jgi:hypothetical protein
MLMVHGCGAMRITHFGTAVKPFTLRDFATGRLVVTHSHSRPNVRVSHAFHDVVHGTSRLPFKHRTNQSTQGLFRRKKGIVQHEHGIPVRVV